MEVAHVVPVLDLGERVFGGFGVGELVVNCLVLVDDVPDEVLALAHVLGLLAELHPHLLVVLSELPRVLSLLPLRQHLLACVPRNLLLYPIRPLHPTL